MNTCLINKLLLTSWLGDEARLRWFGGGRKRNEDLQAGGPKRRFMDGGNPSNWNEPGTFIKQMQISI